MRPNTPLHWTQIPLRFICASEFHRILENSPNVKYYTNMRVVMESLGNSLQHYDWLITDIDGGFWEEHAPQFEDPTVIDGASLETTLLSAGIAAQLC